VADCLRRLAAVEVLAVVGTSESSWVRTDGAAALRREAATSTKVTTT
jgi:hypothetical protein